MAGPRKDTSRKVELVAAPIGMQPGGYVAKAYAGRDRAPVTPSLELEVVRPPGSWSASSFPSTMHRSYLLKAVAKLSAPAVFRV